MNFKRLSAAAHLFWKLFQAVPTKEIANYIDKSDVHVLSGKLPMAMDGFELGDPSSTEAALIQIVYHDKHYKGKHIKLIVEAEVELVTFIGTEEDPDRRKRVCADYKLLRLSALTCELNNNETWKMNPNPAITTAIENLFSKYL